MVNLSRRTAVQILFYALVLARLSGAVRGGGGNGNKTPSSPNGASPSAPIFPSPPASQLRISLNKHKRGSHKMDADRGSGASSTGSTGPPSRRRRLRPRPLMEDWARAVAGFRSDLRMCAEHVRAEFLARTAAVSGLLRDGVSGRHSRAREVDTGYAATAAAVRGKQAEAVNALAFDSVLQPMKRLQTPESPELAALRSENDASVEAIMAVIDSDGWNHVTQKSGVTVEKKFMPAPAKRGGQRNEVVDEAAAAKFACVKAYGTLDADAYEVYKLFLDNERVQEYNDNCQEVKDLEWLSPDTKVAWAASPRYGPFSARDFVTIVHYRTLDDGTMVVVNRPIEHKDAKRGKKYVRAEILIASNIMRPNPSDPTKTDFISVAHINPGGIVDSRIGAKIANALCAQAPVKLLTSLEKAANTPPHPAQHPA